MRAERRDTGEMTGKGELELALANAEHRVNELEAAGRGATRWECQVKDVEWLEQHGAEAEQAINELGGEG